MKVELVYCPAPHACDLLELQVAPGTTLMAALEASGLLQRHGLSSEGLRVGIWGRVQAPETLLREGDRVEVYRPLRVDPKEARRQRYKQHLEKFAGKPARPLRTR